MPTERESEVMAGRSDQEGSMARKRYQCPTAEGKVTRPIMRMLMG
jgi:hypothetical protein